MPAKALLGRYEQAGCNINIAWILGQQEKLTRTHARTHTPHWRQHHTEVSLETQWVQNELGLHNKMLNQKQTKSGIQWIGSKPKPPVAPDIVLAHWDTSVIIASSATLHHHGPMGHTQHHHDPLTNSWVPALVLLVDKFPEAKTYPSVMSWHMAASQSRWDALMLCVPWSLGSLPSPDARWHPLSTLLYHRSDGGHANVIINKTSSAF